MVRAIMHHAPAHHHCVLQHLVGETCHAQRLQPAFGQGKVDRTTTEEAGASGIWSFLVYLDFKAVLRQLHSQQRADQAAADKGDGLLRHGANR
jgi:hypothetical protein